MDFSDLSDALGNHAVWIYLSAVVVAVCEVTTGSALLNPHDLTELVAPVADAAGLDLLSPHVYRACLFKILTERFVPLARVLRAAFEVEPFDFEEGVAPSFDPIAQENIGSGFRINSGGNIVLSLPNLVRWVLVNGMRNPGGHGPLVSIDRVCNFDAEFPATDGVFLQHIRSVDTVLVPCLASIAEADSLAAAHTTLNGMLQAWGAQSFAERGAVLHRLANFLDFWGVAPDPPIFTFLMNDPPPAQPLVAIAGFPQAFAQAVGVVPPLAQPQLYVMIPPIDLAALLLDDEEDEAEPEELDTDGEEDVVVVE